MGLRFLVQGMNEMLHSALRANPPNLQGQIDYIIKQMNSNSPEPEDSDDEQEEEDEEVSHLCVIIDVSLL